MTKKTWLSIRYIFPLTAISYILLFSLKAFYLGLTVYGDGIFYFSWLRSIIIDHDVHFFNEYSVFGVQQLLTSLGLIGNQYAIGPALFWSPIYLLIHTLIQGNGYSFVYQYAVGLLSCFYCLVGLFVLYKVLRQFFSPFISVLSFVGIAWGTQLFFYGSLDTVNSHALSFFVASLLLYLLVQKNISYGLAGFFAGLLGMIRIQDSMFILFPFSLLFISIAHHYKSKTVHIYPYFRNGIALAVGFFIPIAIQFFSWYLVYGDLRIPYLERGYGFSFIDSSFFSVLISPNHGLFFWTPLLLFAGIGLLIKNNNLVALMRITFLFFLWQTYLIGSWSIWWQGASFSGRMFISLLPFFALGLANFLSFLERKGVHHFMLTLFIFVFSILTILLSFYYLWIT